MRGIVVLAIGLSLVAGVLAVAGSTALGSSIEPNGYILRTGGEGAVVVIRDGKEVTVPRNRRFLLYSGDKVRPRDKAWVEYYLSSTREVRREPPLRTSTSVPPTRPTAREAASSILAARRQGSPPAPANRMFTKAGRQPFYLRPDGRWSLSTVTVSPDVKPIAATLKSTSLNVEVHVSREPADADSAQMGVISRGQIHQLTWSDARILSTSDSAFQITVQFSDGSKDTATFEAVRVGRGGSSLAMDRLRRAITAYDRLKSSDEEWFFALNESALAFEALGCNTQAASLVVDWWIAEPENPAVRDALLGLAIPFGLGAIDRLLGPNGGG